MRILSEGTVGENLAAEEVPLSQPLCFAVDLKLFPMVYIPDFVGKIFQLLEQNARYSVHNISPTYTIYYVNNIKPICTFHTYMYMYICTCM